MEISLYHVDTDYCNFLRKYDKCVPYNMDKKVNRPFIGIVLTINDVKYYAPLSSPKPKHLKIKNNVDFLRIDDGVLGAINFNNMIPINDANVQIVDLKQYDKSNPKEVDYHSLLRKQWLWCNENASKIGNRARRLYWQVINGSASPALLKRCCDFKLDEIKCKEYNAVHNKQITNTSMKDRLAAAQQKANEINSNSRSSKTVKDKDRQER